MGESTDVGSLAYTSSLFMRKFYLPKKDLNSHGNLDRKLVKVSIKW